MTIDVLGRVFGLLIILIQVFQYNCTSWYSHHREINNSFLVNKLNDAVEVIRNEFDKIFYEFLI